MELACRDNVIRIEGMYKDAILARLRQHEAELRADGVVSLSLFGSVARGDATEKSDVDLMSDFEMGKRLTLFDKAGLEVRLAEILDTPVDLCERRMLKDEVRLRAELEAVLVF